MFECPNCGGNMKFDIPSQELACEYCRTKLDPYYYEKKTKDAEEQTDPENFEATIFTCPQCGGEILSTDNAAAGFCSFCGASTVLYSRISQEHRPNYIIPFKKTKEDCKVAYTQLMKKAIFAPKELKDPKKIDSFRGIYMPYWAFYITQQGHFRLNAQKSYRRGNYDITDYYNLDGDLDAYYKGISYDASASFADSISQSLAPFDVKGMKAFTPAFFSGFYADTADVPSHLYQPEAERIACTETMKRIAKNPTFSPYTITSKKDPASVSSQFQTKVAQIDQSMFPVWFMSYRNNDRVAYATVNGQTGKVVMDLPVDIKKYLLGSLILTVPLFILLNLFFTVIPSTLLLIVALFALTATIISTTEIRKIARQEAGEDDLGLVSKSSMQMAVYLSKQAHKEKEVLTKQKSTVTVAIVASVFFINIFLTVGYSIVAIVSEFVNLNSLVWIGILIAAVVCAGLGYRKIGEVPGKKGIFGLTAGLLGIAASGIICLLHPVSDLFYYGAAIVTLVTVFITLKEVMDQHNILSTRPLPQFEKKGGDDRA